MRANGYGRDVATAQPNPPVRLRPTRHWPMTCGAGAGVGARPWAVPRLLVHPRRVDWARVNMQPITFRGSCNHWLFPYSYWRAENCIRCRTYDSPYITHFAIQAAIVNKRGTMIGQGENSAAAFHTLPRIVMVFASSTSARLAWSANPSAHWCRGSAGELRHWRGMLTTQIAALHPARQSFQPITKQQTDLAGRPRRALTGR
jgi:hypothetical protein